MPAKNMPGRKAAFGRKHLRSTVNGPPFSEKNEKS